MAKLAHNIINNTNRITRIAYDKGGKEEYISLAAKCDAKIAMEKYNFGSSAIVSDDVYSKIRKNPYIASLMNKGELTVHPTADKPLHV